MQKIHPYENPNNPLNAPQSEVIAATLCDLAGEFNPQKGGNFFEQLLSALQGANPDLSEIDPERLDRVTEELLDLQEVVHESAERPNEEPNGLRARISAILSTERGRQLQSARDIFEDFIDQCKVPEKYSEHGIAMNQYQLTGYTWEMSEMDDEDYDANSVYILEIDHLRVLNDGDFDHKGGKSQLDVRLGKNGNIEYEFSGDKLDEIFKRHLIEIASRKAKSLLN